MLRKLLVISMLLLLFLPALADEEQPGMAEYRKGLELYRGSDYKTAIGYFQDAIDKKKDAPEYHFYTALTYMNLMMYEYAVTEFKWAAYYGKGTKWASDAKKYIAYLEGKELNIVPGLKAGYVYLGINPEHLWLKMGRPEVAEIDLPERYGPGKKGKLYLLDRANFQVVALDDRIIRISTWDPRSVTEKGIRIGHKYEDVVRLYGSAFRLEVAEKPEMIPTAEEAQIFYDRVGIGFVLSQGKVRRFIVYEPGDYAKKP